MDLTDEQGSTDMFEDYPKKSTELPKEFREIYSEYHRRNREGETTASALSQKMERWLHRKIAEDVRETEDRCTLEIGAGTLNQLKHENSRPYDVVEPFSELYMNSPLKDRGRRF